MDEIFIIQGWILIAISILNYILLLTGISKKINPKFGHFLDNIAIKLLAYFMNTIILVIGVIVLNNTELLSSFMFK
ncbi:hypothetical protein [Vallitalea okinawensis]|uniref:hypothetical protein n=1 Tax=Vallitalea okinawensis TaxID=2078660 RepID=UPI000CFD89F5|nr:hypothetical protein [Vallitalea okinawensis]